MIQRIAVEEIVDQGLRIGDMAASPPTPHKKIPTPKMTLGILLIPIDANLINRSSAAAQKS
jgi:hypothetical protein